ncbi:MAG: hypothetical protein KA603_01145 [Azonexus sp.]|nr:hypothetical protein [Betaproteobacteria bacterium]MBP6034725.1 hypothetical protein [Azonexus sp.]MBP6905265.1 hypothetical protein [Azonexus sp.]
MLDVAIGMALIYLLFSGLVSGIQEVVAQLLALRGKLLSKGVELLLGGEKSFGGKDQSPLTILYGHPLIASLSKQGKKPSYMPAGYFATALADTLVREYRAQRPLFDGLPDAVQRMPSSALKQALEIFVLQAQGNSERLRESIESYFNASMDRVSGWYKRNTQVWLFAIAFAAAFVFNVDSLVLVQRLAKDGALTASLVRVAEQQVNGIVARQDEKSSPELQAKIDEVNRHIKDLKDLRIPVGWKLDAKGCPEWPGGMLPIFGWLITAMAATLGAPFWFDALSKLVSLRGAGIKPSPPSSNIGGATPPTPNPLVSASGADVPRSPAIVGPVSDFEATRLEPQDIEAIQLALGIPIERATAELDEPTRAAIRRWQSAKGKPATGTLDEVAVFDLLYPEH